MVSTYANLEKPRVYTIGWWLLVRLDSAARSTRFNELVSDIFVWLAKAILGFEGIWAQPTKSFFDLWHWSENM